MYAELDRLDSVLRSSRRQMRLRVCCPSQEFSADEMNRGVGRWLSCVRGLWESLALANDPDLAIIMLQAPRIPAAAMGYMLALASFRSPLNSVRDRHALLNLDDDRERHLSDKVLDRPELLARLERSVTLAREHGHQIDGLSSYASSDRILQIADALGMSMRETAPRTLGWGHKSGSRMIFRESGAPHPPGAYVPVRTVAGLASTLKELAIRHGPARWLIKLDSGYGSAHGNAVLDATMVAPEALETAIRVALVPMCDTMTRANFLDSVSTVGAVVELFLESHGTAPTRSPSALLYISEAGAPSVLATHEQILDKHLAFVGATFPAESAYRSRVIELARRIGSHLAGLGITGHVGVDFVARQDLEGVWRVDAVEVNLRQTGTTHGHRTVRALVPGRFEDGGVLMHREGHEVVYLSTDDILSPDFRGIDVTSLVRALRRSKRLRFDASGTRGTIPHLWTTLYRYGKVGATFIGGSLDECISLRRDFIETLNDLASRGRGLLKASGASR